MTSEEALALALPLIKSHPQVEIIDLKTPSVKYYDAKHQFDRISRQFPRLQLEEAGDSYWLVSFPVVRYDIFNRDVFKVRIFPRTGIAELVTT